MSTHSMATNSTENDDAVVRCHIDFFLEIHEECDDEFRHCEVEHPDSWSLISRSRNYGLIEKVGSERFENDQRRFIYSLTERCETLISRYDTNDTICPCSCLRDGFLHRTDGYHCPNPACDEGPWTREELDR